MTAQDKVTTRQTSRLGRFPAVIVYIAFGFLLAQSAPACYWTAEEDESPVQPQYQQAHRISPAYANDHKKLRAPKIRLPVHRIFRTELMSDLAGRYHATLTEYRGLREDCPGHGTFVHRIWSSHLLYNSLIYLHSSKALDAYFDLTATTLGIGDLEAEAEERLAESFEEILSSLRAQWQVGEELARQRLVDWLLLEEWFQCRFGIGSPCMAAWSVEDVGPELEFISNGSSAVLCQMGTGNMKGKGGARLSGTCKSRSPGSGGAFALPNPMVQKEARFRCSMLQVTDSDLLRECMAPDPVGTRTQQDEANIDSAEELRKKEKQLRDKADELAKGKGNKKDVKTSDITDAAAKQKVNWYGTEWETKEACKGVLSGDATPAAACNRPNVEGNHENHVTDHTHMKLPTSRDYQDNQDSNRYYLTHERFHGWFREYEKAKGLGPGSLFGGGNNEELWINHNLDAQSPWNRDCMGIECSNRCIARTKLPALIDCFEKGMFGSAADLFYFGVLNCKATQCGITDPSGVDGGQYADRREVNQQCLVATPSEPGGLCSGFTSECIGGVPLMKHLWVVDPAPHSVNVIREGFRVFVPSQQYGTQPGP
jgi:hypothetical protein